MFELEGYLPDPADRLYGPGYVCSHLQILPGQLRLLMGDANVKFSKVIDGVPFLDGHGFTAIAERVLAARAALADAQRKVSAAPSN
jgi:hypothetical protein